MTPKLRSNGLPTGVLTAQTVATIMSLTTNYPAVCRYSTATDTDYSLMTNSNSFFTSDNAYHTYMLTGLVSSFCYSYFIRCRDILDNTLDMDDYIIHFCIAASGHGGTGGGTGGGNGSGTGTGNGGTGTGGTGSGGGGGSGSSSGGGSGVLKPYPIQNTQLPSVALSGFAYPGSTINILKDSQVVGTISADLNAAFLARSVIYKKEFILSPWLPKIRRA